MDEVARLVALTETAALRDVGVQRWECGTAPLSPPPNHVRRGPPRAKFVAGVDVDAADGNESEDLDMLDEMEEDEPAPRVPKVQGSPGPGGHKRPPVTPSKTRGGGGGGWGCTNQAWGGHATSVREPIRGSRGKGRWVTEETRPVGGYAEGGYRIG